LLNKGLPSDGIIGKSWLRQCSAHVRKLTKDLRKNRFALKAGNVVVTNCFFKCDNVCRNILKWARTV
jgi:hypothetical protein